MEQIVDVAIIGGGINGCGCAADAAIRGMSVVLFEQDDLASKTSSSSTKLIHGGLRYLEYYEFNLVKKALEERQTLLTLAPHLVHPQAFVLPYQKYMRPSWFLRLGLFFYDHLSRKNLLPRCKSVYRKGSTYFDPLLDNFKHGFLFYDAATDDARLTIINALQANKYGASIRLREKVIQTEIVDGIWHITVKPQLGSLYQIRARALINATGPWVGTTAQITQTTLNQHITLVKGSHIVVPKLYEGTHAYFLQHTDKRVIFVIPFYGQTMIGTTDVPYSGELEQIKISNEEIDYLIALTNAYFKKEIKASDILYTWSGARPLIAQNKEASALSRDYSYEVQATPAPLISVLGGKITTYRQLAEDVIDQLKPFYPRLEKSSTKNTPLPGARLDSMNFTEYCQYAKKQYNWLSDELLNRYLNNYGTNTELLLSKCTSINCMGKHFAAELYEAELNYLITYEWAQNAEDVLFRRTKLGLIVSDVERQEIEAYISSKLMIRELV
jgi:glycerol-3-phosphate dehydrogenase